MLTEEDVESWNKLFPVCQINKTNLDNPNVKFFCSALVGYLCRFGYNIETPFNMYAESKENRLFLIKLSRQIDHFLKITDKSYSFAYYDLIRPSPKKTAHVLYILLNYYYYYNVYKEDIFKMAIDKIYELKELKANADKTRYDNEQQEKEKINMKLSIESLTEEVPMSRARYKEWDKKRIKQYEEFKKLSHSHQELKEKFKHLDRKQKSLRKRVVTEEEFVDLQSQQRTLKFKLSENKEMENTISSNLNECKESNAHLQKLCDEIDKAHKIISLYRIKELQETKKKLVQLQKDFQVLKIGETKQLHEIEQQTIKKQLLEQEEQIRLFEFEIRQNKLREALASKQNIVKKTNFEFLCLEQKNHLSESQIEQKKDISQYLMENISVILAPYDSY